jgi:hypothetical protein
MRAVIGLQAALCVAVATLLLPAWGIAEEAAPSTNSSEVARPSVEEQAIPNEEASDQNKGENKGEPQKAAANAHDTDIREAICLMIESAARANDLPLEFFARVIWQESRFQPDAVGPLTRSGRRALGIAQFMPGTASERRLLDPFDPVLALPKSAEFLNELRNQFGNLGLAAAAYNAGPRRVQEWLAGSGNMPQETRNYVVAITGTMIDDWTTSGKTSKQPDRAPNLGCRDLMALLKRSPNPFVSELEQHVKLGATRPWGVQLAAGFNRDVALAMYARAMKRLRPVVGDRDPSLLVSLFRSRGTSNFYQVRIGTETRSAADDLCIRIRRAGGACLVLRNMNVRG